MTNDVVPSDHVILDLLRRNESLGIVQLAESMQVTATAVRQRLTRLMAQGYIDRAATRVGRGRPSHRYVLTEKGRRQAGANFADLAMVLWDEVRAIEDPEIRSGLLRRIARRLADRYANRVTGETLEARMRALADVFNENRIPFTVEWVSVEGEPVAVETTSGTAGDATIKSAALPVLKALACPYPVLAEQDRSVCAMERMMFSEVLGESVKLSQCRLDGDGCCSFEVHSAVGCEV